MTAQDVADLVLAAEAERGGGRFALCVGSGKAVESVSALLPDSGRDVFAADTDVGVMPAGRHHPFEDADVYEGLLRAYFGGRPAFDMVLLEATADGGVGRLRPGSIEALEEERWAIAIGAWRRADPARAARCGAVPGALSEAGRERPAPPCAAVAATVR